MQKFINNAILDAIDMEVAILDNAGIIIEVNESWRRGALDNSRVNGRFPQGTMVGANYLDACLKSKRKGALGALEVVEGIQAVINRLIPKYTQDYPLDTPQSRRWFQTTVTPLICDEGGVVISHIDISAPHLHAEKLHKNDVRIRGILSAVQMGIGVLVDDVICEVNDALVILTGYQAEELIGRSFQILYPPAEKFAYIEAEKFCRTTKSGFWKLESRWQTKGGRIIDVALTFVAITHDDLRQEVAFVAQDITAIKNAEHERLAHEARQRKALVSEVHHRIKNNLQGVMGLMGQYIATRADIKAPLEAAIGQIHAISVVHGLQSRLGHSDMRLCDILRELSNTTASLSMTTVPLIEAPDSGNFWLAPSAAVNVALILNELINNALKHAKYDQKVSIKLLEKGSEAKVSIVNSIGLLKRGFDFSSGSGCGTGLGLVRTLMPRRGADLSISCQDGQVCAELVLNPPVLIKSPEPQPLVEGLVWA